MNESLRLVVFSMETEKKVYEYGLPIEQVHEITRPSETTMLPGMPQFVEGVMNLRSNIIPIIDFKKRFGLGRTVMKDTTRVIIVNIDTQKCGVIVDDVLEIVSVSAENIDAAPTVIGGVSSNFIAGLCKVDGRLIIALNPEKVLTEESRAITL